VIILVLGQREDCLSYLDYAAEHGHTVRFLDPPKLPGGDRAQWQRAVADAARASVELVDVDDVVCFHDSFQIQLELLRSELGLPSRDVDALLCLADKTRFKAHRTVREHITRHIEVPLATKAADALAMARETLQFPMVVKPSNGFYSAGVTRADDADSFVKAYIQARRVCTMLRDRTGESHLLVEEYLDGAEYAIDGVVSNGRILPLQLHRKLPPLAGPFFHEIAYLTEPFDPAKGADFVRMLTAIVPGVGLDNSPFHAEFRFDGSGRLRILELAPRLCGGGTTTYEQLMICSGIDAYDLLHRLGREDVDPRPTRNRVALEFDAPITRSGALRNTAAAVAVCEKNDATTVLLHRQDGQFVLAPPLNFETVLTAYFGRDTRTEAEALLDILLTDCTIETEMEAQS